MRETEKDRLDERREQSEQVDGPPGYDVNSERGGVEIEQSELRELRRKVEIGQRRRLVSVGSSGRRLVTEVPHGNG